LTVGIALAQIGEFSFILATIGRELGILTMEATNALVATSIVSIIVNPIAYRSIRPVERWLRERPRLWALLNRESAIPSDLKVSGQRCGESVLGIASANCRGGTQKTPRPRFLKAGDTSANWARQTCRRMETGLDVVAGRNSINR